MRYSNLKSYLEHTAKLLSKADHISLTYGALELRKAIELVVWTQFKDAFLEFITSKPLVNKFEFRKAIQSQSISKMYEMLKKYSPNYVEFAQNKKVVTFQEGEKICWIRGELPNNDYKYLSEILHYEKEFYPQEFKIERSKLNQIFERLNFIHDNYTIQLVAIKFEKEQEILNAFKKEFNLNL